MMSYEVLSVEKPSDNLQNQNPAILWVPVLLQGPGMLGGGSTDHTLQVYCVPVGQCRAR